MVFDTVYGRVHAVRGVNFTLGRGRTLGVVGESGSGKSVTVLSVMRLLPRNTARVTGGEVFFDGRDLLGLPDEEIRRLRGNEISMIFQDPMTSLNPVLTIGEQMTEVIRQHRRVNRNEARDRAVDGLRRAGLPDPAAQLGRFPHQLSGGMRQRVMIAMALACDPRLLIADEPTTALDVTIQAQILDLMRRLQSETGSSIILITHDLGVVVELCEQVLVMYAGRPVEYGTVEEIYTAPAHPYTQGLLASLPRLDQAGHTRLEQIEGLPPNLREIAPGCSFAPRCRLARDACHTAPPAVTEISPGHRVTCHLAGGR